MNNEANNHRSGRNADSTPPNGRLEPNISDNEQVTPRQRLGWSDSTAENPAAQESATGSSGADDDRREDNQREKERPETSHPAAPQPQGAQDDGPAIKGTPTPGHQVPTGRPEESPAVVARPLGGTTPQATNDRPQVPTGAGSKPTPVRPVKEGQRDVAPNFRPAGAASPTTDTRDTAAPEERPENPFAPKEDAERPPRFSRPRLRTPAPEPAVAPEQPAAKRVAGPEPKRLSFSRLRSRAEDRSPLSGRNVAALTIAGVAAVAIVALIVSTALWWFSRDTEVAGADGPDLSATPGPVLSAGQMLSEAMAKDIDPSRTWTQTLDQAGVNDASPGIACIGPLAAGQPIPEITHLRGLSASGDDRTAALHRADAYATNEEAQKVLDFRSAELGACTDTPLYVQNGLTVTGIGDQALGVRLVLQDTKSEYHSVLLVRTGRVVNLLDVVRVGDPVDMEDQLTALGQAVNRQCGPAVGLCTAPVTSVKIGIPPAGGEQPGFLTSGDIPRVTPGAGSWRGNPLSTTIDVQDGSSCEAVDLSSTGGSAVTRQQRTYLLRNDAAAPPQFGIDQVVLTMGSPEEAQALVSKIDDNMSSCGTRTLTSRMTKQAPLATPGQDGVEVRGNWYDVDSKIGQAESQKYRVGVFSAGNKFVYLRSNPTEVFDFSDESWIAVNLRAGERVTQVA